MKKIFCFCAAFAAVTLACQKIEPLATEICEKSSVSDSRTFEAFTESDDETKVHLSNRLMIWDDGDNVAVFPGFTSVHRYYVPTGKGGSSSTVLKEADYIYDYDCDGIPDVDLTPADSVSIGNNVAIYPYRSNYTCSPLGNGRYNVTFTYRTSPGIDDFPMVAVTTDVEDSSLGFNNLAGILKLSLKSSSGPIALAGVVLSGNNDEVISGKATVTVSHDSAPEIVMPSGGGKTITVIPDECLDRSSKVDVDDGNGVVWLNSESPATLLIPIPPTVFSKGITVQIVTATGIIEKKTTKELVVERSKIKPLTELTLETSPTVLYYYSTDGQVVTPSKLAAWDKDGNSLSYTNTYGSNPIQETCGVITFSGIVDTIDFSFEGCTTLTEIVMPSNPVKVKSATSMFNDCASLQSVDLKYFDFSETTDMSRMFRECSSLTRLWGLGSLNTSNVTNMRLMFSGCESISALDVSGFDTSNVTDMCGMFQYCQNLTSLDVSSFNTSNVTMMRYMFKDCKNLSNLDLRSFNTSEVTNMYAMFSGCEKLETLDVSSFNTSKALYMEFMFNGCDQLSALDVSGFNTANVAYMTAMFQSCHNLKTLDVSKFNTSKVVDMCCMFNQCYNLKALDVSGFDTSNVTDMSGTFSECSGISELDVSGFNTANVTSMSDMFSDCKTLKALDLSGFDTSNVTDIQNMMLNCSSLCTIKVGANTNKVFDATMLSGVSAKGILLNTSESDYSQWLSVLGAGWTVQKSLYK